MREHVPELMEQFIRMEGLLRRYQGYSIRRYGFSGNPLKGQGRVLSILKLQPTITQKELGYLLDMRNQSLGELLTKLEKNGFITRAPSEEDRRTTVVTLTEEGKKAAEGQEADKTDLDQIFDCLTPEERAALTGYLDRIIESLEKACAELSGEEDYFNSFREEFHRHFWHGRGNVDLHCRAAGLGKHHVPHAPHKPHVPYEPHRPHYGFREVRNENRTGPKEYRPPEEDPED